MPNRPGRRAADALRAVDGLLESHQRRQSLGGRALARLAAAIAIEHSGARSGVLLLEEGGALTPVLALDQRLEVVEPAAWDEALVEEARSRLAPIARDGAVAAPIVVDGRARGCLYLLATSPQTEAVGRLAGQVTTRIAALVASAELVEELARSTRSMATLEALGALLAGGELRRGHLERVVAAAADSTGSREAALGLLDSDGRLADLLVRAPDDVALTALAARVAAELRTGGELDRLAPALGRHLLATFRSRLVPEPDAAAEERTAGFLLVRGRDDRYRPADRSFFHALGHLLEGTLARIDYFRRASEDPLTSTGTRLALNLALAEAETIARQSGLPYSTILVDVDRFKEINDTHGHLAGDVVLREIADLLRSRLRARDSVARYGGDEFLLILPMTATRDAARLASELRRLAARGRFGPQRLQVSLSMGVATRGDDDDTAAVLRRADAALYTAKSGGRDRVSVDPKAL